MENIMETPRNNPRTPEDRARARFWAKARGLGLVAVLSFTGGAIAGKSIFDAGKNVAEQVQASIANVTGGLSDQQIADAPKEAIVAEPGDDTPTGLAVSANEDLSYTSQDDIATYLQGKYGVIINGDVYEVPVYGKEPKPMYPPVYETPPNG